MKNLTITTGVLAALFATGLSGCGEKPAAQGRAPGAASAAASAPRFAAVVLQPAPASEGITATGTVLAEQEVNVQTEIAGRVIRIGFGEGEPVKAGQILVELDGAELRAQADRAEAGLMLAKSRAQRTALDYKARAVSRSEQDQAEASLKTAQAEAALTRAQWEKTRIRAPFDGTAGLREVELGTVVQPGARVTSLQNLASLRVEFSVPERQASDVRPGQTVRFTAAGTVDTLEAAVYAVESRIDPDTRLLRVRARTKTADGSSPAQVRARAGVMPGAFARVDLPLRADSALWVPAEAVVQSANGSQVWLARGGTAVPRVFTPGMRTSTSVEAAAGLSRGDTLFVSGLLQLRPGAPATPVVSVTSAGADSTASAAGTAR